MKNILVLGDSHSKVFENKNIKKYNFTVVSSVGASAQGLLNIKSKTNSLKNILDFFKNTNKNFDTVVLYFGEVDCNATIWYYKEKYNQTLDESVTRTISNYNTFIQRYIKTKFVKSNIILFSPTLPTVQDGYTNKGKLRKHIDVPLKERTDLTLKFEKYLSNLEFPLLSINDILLDRNTGVIDRRYVHNPADHHLKSSTAFNLWINKLNSIFDN